MNIFNYQGRNLEGKIIAGKMKATTLDEVLAYLEQNHITPLNIEKVKQPVDLFNLIETKLGLNKVSAQELLNFCRQVAILNAAGVPIVKILTQLAQSTKSRTLSAALYVIADDVTAGKSFSAALASHKQIFSQLFISIVEIGENTGHLNESLLQLANFLEISITNRRRLLSAVRYPTIVIIGIVVAIITMNIFVIPNFAAIFSQFKAQLPLQTRVLIAISTFMLNNGPSLIVALILLIFLGKYLLQIPAVRVWWDQRKLKIPVMGKLQQRIILAQFCWTFSLILRSGVPVIGGLILAGNSTGNAYFRKQITLMRSGIEHGTSFHQAAAESGLFPASVLQMIEIGEESGKLEEVLNEVSRFYENEVDYDIKRLNELLEPFLLLIVGGMVLFLALSIYLPVWDLAKTITGQ